MAKPLSGVILAGDSWLANESDTKTIGSQIGQKVTNVAVGGSTTADTLNQLNSFMGSGGTFAPGSTVMLDIGGNDFLQGASADSVKNNLQQIVGTLGSQGVKVVLSGAPAVGSVADVTGSKNLAMSSIYKDVAAGNKNVTLVDSMSGLLNQKNLVDETGFHLNEAGRTAFNASLSNAYLQSEGRAPLQFSDQAIRDFAAANNLTPDQAAALAPSFGLTPDRVSKALSVTDLDAQLIADEEAFNRTRAEIEAMTRQEENLIRQQTSEFQAAQDRIRAESAAQAQTVALEQAMIQRQIAEIRAQQAAEAAKFKENMEGMQRDSAQKQAAAKKAGRSTGARPLLGSATPDSMGQGGQSLGSNASLSGQAGSLGAQQTLGVGA